MASLAENADIKMDGSPTLQPSEDFDKETFAEADDDMILTQQHDAGVAAPRTETAFSRLLASKRGMGDSPKVNDLPEDSPPQPRRRRVFGKGRAPLVFDTTPSKPTDTLQHLTEHSSDADEGKDDRSIPPTGSDDNEEEDSLSLTGFPVTTTTNTDDTSDQEEESDLAASPSARISMLSSSTNTPTQEESQFPSVVDDEEDPFMDSASENGDGNEDAELDESLNEGESKPDRKEEELDGRISNDDQEQERRADEAESKKSSKDTTTSPIKKLDNHELLTSVDQLFDQLEDISELSVNGFFRKLRMKLHCKLNKSQKEVVKKRLQSLMAKQQEEEQDEAVSDTVEDSEPESDAGGEEEQDGSDYEEGDEGEEEAPKTRRRRAKKQASPSDRKQAKSKPKRPRSTRKESQQMKKKLSAVRKQAEMLRRRRMEELRVRNEELQALQEDESRAERIAAKLDTNTDQHQRRRLEQRVELVEKLSKKRISVINHAKALPGDDSDKSSGSSSDESEIELVGDQKAKSRPLFAVEQRNLALGLLDLADRGARLPKKPAAKKSLPSQPITGRAALKARLKTQQRHMGNWWLARELNYKSVKEHVKDCKIIEEKKRLQTLQKEQAQIEFSNQQLRNRLERGAMSDNDMEEETKPLETEGDTEGETKVMIEEKESAEEDEEVALATQVELEREQTTDKEVVQATQDPEEPSRPIGGEDQSYVDERNNIEKTVESSDEEEIEVALETQCPNKIEILQSNDMDVEDGKNTPSSSQQSTANIKDGRNNDIATDIKAMEEETEPPASREDEATGAIVEEPTVAPRSSPRDPEQAEDTKLDPGSEADQDVDRKKKSKGPRNQGWKALLQKEAENAKRLKRRKANNGGLVQEEADEEEEEDIVGLEDFGFRVKKRSNDDDDSDAEEDGIRKTDLEGVVDDVSDGEGDEEAGENARKAMQAKEDKERHKEILRRMREGYDGRRGGIGSGAGTRGVHRFDQLTAAENREDAKRLGLLNDDEMDSDGEGNAEKADGPDEEEDEAAFLDKILKDRHLHRSSVEVENFSEDEEEETNDRKAEGLSHQDQDEEEQERVAKRFAKRARMQRLIEQYGDEEEFSQARLIDEDTSLKFELQKMKNGLARKRSHSSTLSDSRQSSVGSTRALPQKRQAIDSSKTFGSSLIDGSTTLGLALQASRRSRPRLVTSWKSSDASVFRQPHKHPISAGFSSSRVGSLSSSNSKMRVATKQTVPKKVAGSSSLWANAIGHKKGAK